MRGLSNAAIPQWFILLILSYWFSSLLLQRGITDLKDDAWNEIKKASRLPEECRNLLMQEIDEYWSHLARTSAPRSVRRFITQAQGSARKLQDQLETIATIAVLQANGIARFSPAQLKLLKQVKNDLSRLDRELSRATLKLKHVPHQIPEDWSALGNFIWRVLMIRSEALRKAMPTSISENAATGKYRTYVESCVRAADRKIDPKRIERSLIAAIALYQRVRSDDEAFTKNYK